jgi:D-serine deaminase-like pyridoxal phosphate-dependent protein
MTDTIQDTAVESAARERAIGRERTDLTTPALILDLDVARSNIERMAERMRELPAELRPHIKVHKSARLARMQVEAGAIGVTAATVWEAIAMARGGVDDILIANQVVGDRHIAALTELARTARVMVAVDDAANVKRLGQAAVQAGSRLGVLVEVDTGMGRCGVRTPAAARELAEVAGATDGLDFRGVSGYEGHCMLEPDTDVRVREAGAAAGRLLAAVDAIGTAGIGCEIVSAGGTGTYYLTGAHTGITEIQAGSYAVMDAFHESLVPGGFEIALTVLATVISRQGDQVVLDAGRKAIGIDNMLPRLAGADSEPLFVHEEHSGFAVPDDSSLRVGDRVELQSGYAPTTANLHDVYHVVERGVVTDLWPLEARYGIATLG